MTTTFTPPQQPTVGTDRKLEFRVWSAKFGDGYEQRAAKGINSTPEIWDVRWDNLTFADAATIYSFLSGTKGSTSFIWTPPGYATTYKYVVTALSEHPGTTRSSISATFQQVYEP